jgi:hypothetical protein
MIEFYQSALHICIGYNPRIKTRGWQIFSQMVRKVSTEGFVTQILPWDFAYSSVGNSIYSLIIMV